MKVPAGVPGLLLAIGKPPPAAPQPEMHLVRRRSAANPNAPMAERRNRANCRFGSANMLSISASIASNVSKAGRLSGPTNLFAGPTFVVLPGAVVEIASVNGVVGEFAGNEVGLNVHALSAGRPVQLNVVGFTEFPIIAVKVSE